MEALRFSLWTHWNQRLTLEVRGRPGVYLLARFEDGVPGSIDPHDSRVLLVAETHGQTLERRWEQFHYCAFAGGAGHSGGRTFHKLFCNGPDSQVPEWLYVSAHGVPSATKDVESYVQALKNELLAAYQDQRGVLPVCNTQGPAEMCPPATPASGSSGEQLAVPTRGVEEPQVTFSRWRLWSERDRVEGMECAGVYALGRFDAAPTNSADVLDQCVIYIGETCDNCLSGRLWQFNRSAFMGKNGHSGGWSYRNRCADEGGHLYVCVFPVALQEPHRSAFIRHTERRLLWEYVRRWGRRPLCNSK